MADFQQQVNTNPAPAIEGSFASDNPRSAVPAGPGSFVAGVGGVRCARFVWADPGAMSSSSYGLGSVAGVTVSNSNLGSGAPLGFVARQGLVPGSMITAFLASATMQILQGQGVTVWKEGDFWVLNSGTADAVVGMKAFANFADGSIYFAAAGATPTAAASFTGSVAASTGSFTGTITDNVLNITAVGSGVARPGGTLSGTNVVTGTKIVSQLTGTAGGVGTYLVSIGGQSVTSTTISETYGTLTVSAATTGSIGVGSTIVAGGGGNTATVGGTRVTQLITGTGGTGTYALDNNTVVTSGTIVFNGAIETKWQCQRAAAAGELSVISNVTIFA